MTSTPKPPTHTGDGTTLCVDLDGTLVASDMLVETAIALLRRHPLDALLIPVWLAHGRAFVKQEIAARVPLEPQHWPYREDVVDYLRREHAGGRPLVLATASDARIAHAAAAHLGLFREVLASDGKTNLKGERKAALLAERYGARGFAYAGDAPADLPVWRKASAAIVVGARRGLAERVGQLVPIEARLANLAPDSGVAMIELLRPHQWVKNLLLLVPLLTAHRFADPAAWFEAMHGIAAMSLIASAVYAANDVLDVASDRRHPTKRHRPVARGATPPLVALVVAMLSLALGALLESRLPAPFAHLCAVYVAVATAYSLWLKRWWGIDVLVLAFLYTTRVLLGAAAIDVPPSPALVVFTTCLFLSLALLKRYVELDDAARRGADAVPGRGYAIRHRPAVLGLGTASGLAATFVVAAYAVGPDGARYYARPSLLVGLAPLIFVWLARAWITGYRGAMHDDPIVHALRDPVSYAIVAAMTALTLLAR